MKENTLEHAGFCGGNLLTT